MGKFLTFAAAATLLLGQAALAQTAAPAPKAPIPAETVTWSAAANTAAVKPDGALTVTLNAKVAEGWHVYALNQLPNGPTPLRISVDANAVAAANGAPTASPATKVHDAAFNLDTPLYSKAFSASVPVKIAAHASAGKQTIPVTVRFQTCNGAICQPPKTIHLSAPVTIQ
jgi:DsbC/DsbD-like thiol-disulfide interchange protein